MAPGADWLVKLPGSREYGMLSALVTAFLEAVAARALDELLRRFRKAPGCNAALSFLAVGARMDAEEVSSRFRTAVETSSTKYPGYSAMKSLCLAYKGDFVRANCPEPVTLPRRIPSEIPPREISPRSFPPCNILSGERPRWVS